jgi:hypothetical protein
MQPEPASPRARLAIAAGAAVVLIAIVVAVTVAGGGGSEEPEVVTAPQRCVAAWNEDAAARSYGRHNFSFHLYTGALVTYLTKEGTEVGAEEGGLCAVIFPSESLDTEPVAAGQVYEQDLWSPISAIEGIQLTRVAELQAQAAQGPNTTLDRQGVLTPL